ncbi:hypothetical protein [Lacinutrix sp. Bg11-31]|uniref:hypothetical protein n=1 Tax=Lacinutrix sp. Bg11-31 TaxID=2057808 RepID=UPI000C300D43|nr:hypothetical protein [Lacinutrix sp. Bg11-31]AUC82194.1 hypothetical protein CW733_08655 [Lacinutrix sp. Bg11-31]
MKTIKTLLYSFLFLLLCLNFSCKNTNTNSVETESTKDETPKFKNKEIVEYKQASSTIRKINIDEGEHETYSNKSLHVVSGKENSYIKEGNIFLDIPVPNADYYGLYKEDVSSSTISAIVYVITDRKEKGALEKVPTHILEDKISLSFIGGSVKDGKLVVFVVNDTPDDFRQSKKKIITQFREQIANNNINVDCLELFNNVPKSTNENPKPKEACGGIIVE